MSLRRKKSVDLGTFTTNSESVMSNSSDFRTATITLINTGFTGTVKFLASNALYTGDAPDLSVAASSTNEYAVVQSINLQTGDNIAGGTGIATTTDTSVTRYEINDNNNNFVWIQTSSVSAGSVVVRLDMVDNQ